MRIRWLCSFQIWPGNCSWSIEDSDELLAFSSIPLYRIAVTMGNIRCWKQKWGAHFWAFLNSLNVHGSSLAHLLLVFLNLFSSFTSSISYLWDKNDIFDSYTREKCTGKREWGVGSLGYASFWDGFFFPSQ